MVAMLERTDLSGADGENSENVLTFARRKLGYTHPEKTRLAKNALTEALRVMGHKPFTNASVELYKEKMQRKHTSSQVRELASVLFLLCLSEFGLVPLVVVSAVFALRGQDPATYGWFIAGYAVILLVLACFSKTQSAHWELYPLQKYKGEIPEFVLATAMEVKQRVPGVVLYVDELSILIEDKSRTDDPFLVARYKGFTYYLEVWNEPDFKQVREK